MYVNYHRHSFYSNIITPDSTVSNEDYAIRALELGHTLISSLEHGWSGRSIETFELAKTNKFKFLFGVESYFVKDRFEKDRTNAHLILLAKNESGRRNINRILSEANLTGYYYRARIDLDLLLSLPYNDVWVTTACLGGIWKYDDYEDLILKFKNHFKNNFFLEVQNHNTSSQAELNYKILNLSNKYDIPIIFGCDSHYIYPEQANDRDDYLLSKHVEYEDEKGWFLDYPTEEDVVLRFKTQGVLSHSQISEAINNTNIFLNVEEYTSNIFEKKMKLPSVYPDKSQEEKNIIFSNLIWKQWNEEKNNIPRNRWATYEIEIKKEEETVIETGMADYFLLDYEVVKRGKELGGHITMTGRGSAPSFYISKLLGFTTIDRIDASVKLFPERFITKERILDAGTLPDIDFNLGNPEIFAQAQIDVLGENHSYPMVAYGTLQPKAAWKLYARAKNVDFETANIVSSQIQQYEYDVLKNEDDYTPNVLDYIDKEFHQIFEGSKKYLGIVSDSKIHPCGYILFDGNIKEEFGLIKVKENICAAIDGLWAEKYSFLKNDLLKVSVVELIYKVYQRIGVEPHPFPELLRLCENNQKVWDIYKNSWTMGINQVEQPSTKGRVAKYAPKNISEVSAFVAAIRPGFKSNYKQFEAREDFSYGIESLDKILQTKEFPQSYILYQEQAMLVMAYAGIPISETYEVVKNIAKKRPEKVHKYKEQFVDGMTKKVMKVEKVDKNEAEDIAYRTWQIIEDSSRYSFNACISGTTKIDRAGITYSKFSPTIEEMYEIMNNKVYAINSGHYSLHKKYRNYGYGNALSMYQDGRIRKNKIINIYRSGIRNTYKITLSNGSWIICTNNHKFPTPYGEKPLFKLKIGDELYIKGIYEINNGWHGFTNGKFIKNTPIKGQRGFQKIENGQYVLFRNLRKEKVENNISCEICEEQYKINKKFELHHIDGNRTNNQKENLIWVCNSCHKKEDYKLGRNKVYEKGIPATLANIISIEYHDKEMVYDIEMEGPAHNFISDNGLVTSNSHSYSVAGDSLYGAYLKAYYPLEFYEVFLNLLEEDGDKNRIVKTIEEAQSAFGIIFPPYKFGQDNRAIVAQPENNAIMASLSSIKGFSKSIGETMYELSQKSYSSFLELLTEIENSGKMSSKLEQLIRINYFDMFGGNKKLLEIYKEFTSGKNRYSNKHKDDTKVKRLIALQEFANNLPDERMGVYEQITAENDILGNIRITYPNIDKRFLYVLTVDTKFSPRIELYCLATGKRDSIKIQKNIYDNNIFYGGEIIYGKHFTKKPLVKFVDGTFENVPDQYQWWMDSYKVIQLEEFDKMIKDKI